MTKTAALRAVPADFGPHGESPEPVDADEFANAVSGALDEAAAQREFLVDVKTLVQRTRTNMQTALDELTRRKQATEKRIALAGERCNERQATAQRAYDEAKAAALAEHVADLADAEDDLAQISSCKEAINLAVARLNKA